MAVEEIRSYINLEKVWTFAKDFFWISVGLALYASAWNIFVLPHGFVGGGFGGISAMVFYLTGVPISVTYLGCNVVLCAIAWFILGNEFSIKTVFGILGLTLFLSIIPVPEAPIITEKLLSAIMGGIIGGAGVATYLLRGASTGGSDIIVMIVSKFKNVSWGKVYLMFDACVIASSYFLPSSTIDVVAYGFVFMGVSSYTIDMVSNGRRQSVQMFIFTSKYREVADQIIHKHHRGATLFESIGWYTKQHRKTIFLVVRKRESQEIFKTVKLIDPNAFIAVSNVMSVFGIGFDAIKAGFTKAQLTDENGNVVDTTKKDGNNDDDDEMTEVFMPEGGLKEGEVSDSLLLDEKESQRLIAEGKGAEYNPNWQTPASELLEIPEMPMIPKDMHEHAVSDYPESDSFNRVQR